MGKGSVYGLIYGDAIARREDNNGMLLRTQEYFRGGRRRIAIRPGFIDDHQQAKRLGYGVVFDYEQVDELIAALMAAKRHAATLAAAEREAFFPLAANDEKNSHG